MAEYTVNIEATWTGFVRVEAESAADAERIVNANVFEYIDEMQAGASLSDWSVNGR